MSTNKLQLRNTHQQSMSKYLREVLTYQLWHLRTKRSAIVEALRWTCAWTSACPPHPLTPELPSSLEVAFSSGTWIRTASSEFSYRPAVSLANPRVRRPGTSPPRHMRPSECSPKTTTQNAQHQKYYNICAADQINQISTAVFQHCKYVHLRHMNGQNFGSIYDKNNQLNS